MITPNTHYADLKDSYLFYNIAQKTKAYLAANPDKHLYRMGIGDVSLPLCDAVIRALHEAVDDQAKKENFHGNITTSSTPFCLSKVTFSSDKVSCFNPQFGSKNSRGWLANVTTTDCIFLCRASNLSCSNK